MQPSGPGLIGREGLCLTVAQPVCVGPILLAPRGEWGSAMYVLEQEVRRHFSGMGSPALEPVGTEALIPFLCITVVYRHPSWYRGSCLLGAVQMHPEP